MADKGFVDQAEGKIKEVAGNVTGDEGTKAEGVLEQAVGKAKEVAADVKDAAVEVGEKIQEAVSEGK